MNWHFSKMILGSVPSLGAGLVFGTALAFGAFHASQNPPQFAVQLCTSSLLAGVMGYRFYNSGKIMPAGLVCALSLAMIARIGLRAAGFLDTAVNDVKPH